MRNLCFLILVFHIVVSEKLVLVGGALEENNLEVFHTILELPSKDRVDLAIITAASDPTIAEENGKYYIDLFKKNSPGHVHVEAWWVPIDLDKIYNNKDPEIVKKLSESDVFFFGGGDQGRLMTCFFDKKSEGEYERSPAIDTILKRFASNASVIAGTSAGTAIQSDPKFGLVDGGESFYALKNGPHDSYDPDHPDNLVYVKGGGFGTMKNFLVDTHFSTRGREGRIIELGRYVGASWVLGVDQNTALVVLENHMKVIGQSGVFFFDLRKSVKGSDSEISGVYATYLTEGDQIVFKDEGEPIINYAKYKSNMKGHEKHEYPIYDREDIWSSPDNDGEGENDRKYPKQFQIVACDLCDCYGANHTKGTSYHSPVQTVRFYKVYETTRYAGEIQELRKISFHKMKIDIEY